MSFPEDLQHIIHPDRPLAPMLWLGIGGPARYYAEPVDVDQLQRLVKAAAGAEMPVRILGDGSNVLVRESGFDGLVISLSAACTSELKVTASGLTAGAGAKLSHVVIKAVGEGLGGLEHLVGIPGSLGAAVVGNVSAGGRDIGSVVQSLTVLDTDGSIRTVSQEEAGFSHRKTSLSGLVLLDATFVLESSDSAALTKRMQKLWINRNATRPALQRQIAMPFVDPDGLPAKELIQSVGMGGIREGDVSLDAAQPDYLIAHEGATSDQCLKLIERVREQVSLQTGVDLQLNMQIW